MKRCYLVTDSFIQKERDGLESSIYYISFQGCCMLGIFLKKVFLWAGQSLCTSDMLLKCHHIQDKINNPRQSVTVQASL